MASQKHNEIFYSSSLSYIFGYFHRYLAYLHIGRLYFVNLELFSPSFNVRDMEKLASSKHMCEICGQSSLNFRQGVKSLIWFRKPQDNRLFKNKTLVGKYEKKILLTALIITSFERFIPVGTIWTMHDILDTFKTLEKIWAIVEVWEKCCFIWRIGAKRISCWKMNFFSIVIFECTSLHYTNWAIL